MQRSKSAPPILTQIKPHDPFAIILCDNTVLDLYDTEEWTSEMWLLFFREQKWTHAQIQQFFVKVEIKLRFEYIQDNGYTSYGVPNYELATIMRPIKQTPFDLYDEWDVTHYKYYKQAQKELNDLFGNDSL